MKGIGLLLLIATGGGVGWLRTRLLYQRAEGLSTIHQLIVWLMREIRYTAAPIGILLQRAGACAEFSSLPFLKEYRHGEESINLWKECGKEFHFTQEDMQSLVCFVNGLGCSDVEGQLTHGALYAEVFEERSVLARQTAKEKGRVEQVLWFSGGCAVALLLL